MKPQPLMTYFGVDLIPVGFQRVGVWGWPNGDFVTLANAAAFNHFVRVIGTLPAGNDNEP